MYKRRKKCATSKPTKQKNNNNNNKTNLKPGTTSDFKYGSIYKINCVSITYLLVGISISLNTYTVSSIEATRRTWHQFLMMNYWHDDNRNCPSTDRSIDQFETKRNLTKKKQFFANVFVDLIFLDFGIALAYDW